MKKLLITTVAACVLFSGAAFAFGDIVLAPPEKEKPDRGNGADHPFPYDTGRLNESPIRGKGQIRVEHNMPTLGDPNQKLTEALWLLQDNSWTCYKPKVSRR